MLQEIKLCQHLMLKMKTIKIIIFKNLSENGLEILTEIVFSELIPISVLQFGLILFDSRVFLLVVFSK